MKGTFFFKRDYLYVLSSDWLNYWFDTFKGILNQGTVDNFNDEISTSISVNG